VLSSLYSVTLPPLLLSLLAASNESAPRMRIVLGLGLLVLLVCGPGLADTVYYRCIKAGGKGANPKEVMIVTIDPLVGEMKAERYSAKTLRSRSIYQIEEANETIRGRYVSPKGIVLVLELDRRTGHFTETIGGKEPTYYDCEPPGSALLARRRANGYGASSTV
jgi:hypothetical protein